MDFEPETGAITYYVVVGVSEGLFRTAPQYQLAPAAIAAVGDNLLTIDAKALDFQRAPQSGTQDGN